MIVEAWCTLQLRLFATLFNFHIDPLPNYDDIVTMISIILNQGIDIFRYFMPPFCRTLLLLIIAIHLAADVYFLVMWIIKKIPFLGIK